MDTCDICNNSDDFSRGRAKKHPAHIQAIRRYKKIHLKQQQHERMVAEFICEESRKLGTDGQPLQYYLDIDGMTELTGNFPGLGNYTATPFNESAIITIYWHGMFR